MSSVSVTRGSRQDEKEIFKVAVRSAITFGAETWSIKKSHAKKTDVSAMKVMRWACVTPPSTKSRTEIRERLKVTKCIDRSRRRDYSGTVMH